MFPLPAAARPVSWLMAEKSLVNEVAESVGTAVGLGDELGLVVVVFFEQAVSTTARASVRVSRVLGRWSFMDAGPLCLLLGCSTTIVASSMGARTYVARGRPPCPRRGRCSGDIIPAYFHYISLRVVPVPAMASATHLSDFFFSERAHRILRKGPPEEPVDP